MTLEGAAPLGGAVRCRLFMGQHPKIYGDMIIIRKKFLYLKLLFKN